MILTEAAMPDVAGLSHAARDIAVYTSGIGQSQAMGHDPGHVAQLANIPANLLKPQDQHEVDLSQGFGL